MHRIVLTILIVVIAKAHVFGTELYVGGLMGVSARVVLCRGTERAKITLSGLPIGYYPVSGTAMFRDENRVNSANDNVIISEPLATLLRRRFVKIAGVRHDTDNDFIVVTMKLPLILGTQKIVLRRAKDPDDSSTHMLAQTCHD